MSVESQKKLTLPILTDDSVLERAYKEGWIDGDQGYPKNHNPYRKGEARREWWDAGWLRSLDELCGT